MTPCHWQLAAARGGVVLPGTAQTQTQAQSALPRPFGATCKMHSWLGKLGPRIRRMVRLPVAR